MYKAIRKLMRRKRVEKAVVSIPVERIKPGPFQTRRNVDEQKLIDLARSIMAYGLIQPIVVRPWGRGYQIIAGERRFKACCLLGRTEIEAIIREVDDERAAILTLSDNLQRADLSYLEEAEAYSRLMEVFGLNPEKLAAKIVKSPLLLDNKLRLLKLPEYMRGIIENAGLTERQAGELLKINGSGMQEEVIRQIYEKGLGLKETEELVERLKINNIPMEKQERNNQSVSMIIRDGRIFLNTIKETVKRARQTGIDIYMAENEDLEQYEITIRISRDKRRDHPLAKSV